MNKSQHQFTLRHLTLAVAGALVGVVAQGQTSNSPAAASTSAAGKVADSNLPTIEVVGRRQSGSYHADEASGTKNDLPLRELPQAVRVMSRQTIDDLGAVRLDDALDYVGGVSRQNHFGGLWDNVAIRGLAGDINNGMSLLLNGFSGNRGFNGPRDLAGIERIEFLKGPAASLYGTSEPGGTINLVTKVPLWKSAHSVEAYAGNQGFLRTTLDSTGPLSDNFAYRLNAAAEKRNGFRDNVETKRAVLAPAFAWKITPFTRLDYTGEVLRHSTPLDRGVVAVNRILGVIPRERFLGEPADGDMTVKNQTHQAVLSTQFSESWNARLAASYKGGSLYGFSTEAQAALQPDQRTLRRQRRFRDYSSDDLTVQGEVTGRITTGTLNHELMLGVETYRFKIDQLMNRVNPTAAAPYAIDIFNPVYGQPQPVPLPNTNTREEQRNLALYAQDVVAIGAHWRLLGGLRLDHHDQTLQNRLTGVRTEQTPNAASPRVGITFLPTTQWSMFANAGKSFRPNTGVSFAGSAFAPEAGRALEAGVKWESADKSLGGTLAFYDIRKKNVLTADPLNAGFSIAAGEVRSRGFDFDLSGQLTRHWRVNSSFSYIDAKVLRDNTLPVGAPLLNVPKVNGSLLLVYEDAVGTQGRYGIGGGVTHTGKRLGEARTQAQVAVGTPAFELPAYTVAKLTAYWKLNQTWRFSLDVDNLFDKTYYTNSFQSTWVAVGSPRTVTLGVQAKF